MTQLDLAADEVQRLADRLRSLEATYAPELAWLRRDPLSIDLPPGTTRLTLSLSPRGDDVPLHVPRLELWGAHGRRVEPTLPISGVTSSGAWPAPGDSRPEEQVHAAYVESLLGLRGGFGYHTTAGSEPFVTVSSPDLARAARVVLHNRPDDYAWRNERLQVSAGAGPTAAVVLVDVGAATDLLPDLVDRIGRSVLGRRWFGPQSLFRRLVAALVSQPADGRAVDLAMRDLVAACPDVPVRTWSALDPWLAFRHRAWTPHGSRRTFRFHGPRARRELLAAGETVCQVLRDIGYEAAVGYGCLLGLTRAGDLIDHDDDLDLLAIPVSVDPRADVEELGHRLRSAGLDVTGDHAGHRHVTVDSDGGPHTVDIFLATSCGDGFLFSTGTEPVPAAVLVPTTTRTHHDLEVSVPADPVGYLEHVYGPCWRTPDSTFSHAWSGVTPVEPDP